MKGPGGLFEAQVMASMPTDWPGLFARKVPDPPTRRTTCSCGGPIVPLCTRCHKPQQHAAKFTAPNPWDIEVRFPAPGGGLIEILIECKSSSGAKRKNGSRGTPTLSVDVLKKKRKDGTLNDIQERQMIAAQKSGAVAGVLWEARGEGAYSGHCEVGAWFIPIRIFLAIPAEEGRKSWTPELADNYGTRLRIDGGRGRTKRYYQMGEFLELFKAPERSEADPRLLCSKYKVKTQSPGNRENWIKELALETEK